MGAIGRALANSLTTGGVVSASAINNTSVTNVTTLPSGVDTGDLVLISSQTASASASISFTTGLDSTYDEYIFKFIDIHPATDNVSFTFNMSTDGGSSYNVTKTTTSFPANHEENDGAYNFGYQDFDLAQSTAYQILARLVGTETDDNVSGSMTLFNPSSTTFVKHFISTTNNVLSISPPYSEEMFIAGYGNTTSAVNAIRFQMSSGNIDDGIIKLYGVKKS
jgi:hypothetical protein